MVGDEMKKFAEIKNNQIHKIYEQEAKPLFASYIELIEITDITPIPEEGWLLLDNGTFSSPKENIETMVTVEDRLEAIEQTSAYTQIQVEYLATLAEINNGL